MLILNVSATTKINNTSVGVDVGDVFTWVATQVNEDNDQGYIKGFKIEYTVKNITNDLSPYSYLHLFVDMRMYYPLTSEWKLENANLQILDYNQTTHYFDQYLLVGYPLILPLPLNFTCVIDEINNHPSNYNAQLTKTNEFSAARFDTDEGVTVTYIYKIDSKGITTSIIQLIDDELVCIFSLEDNNSNDLIFLSMIFLIVMIPAIGALAVIIINRRR